MGEIGEVYITENGYSLCGRHMAAWRANGWNGEARVVAAQEVAYIEAATAGDPGTWASCADCEDENDPESGDSSHAARCDGCGADYYALGPADDCCDRCASWAEVSPSR